MRQVCFAIIGLHGMYMSETCVSEDRETLRDEIEMARKVFPNEDYDIYPLYTLRRGMASPTTAAYPRELLV